MAEASDDPLGPYRQVVVTLDKAPGLETCISRISMPDGEYWEIRDRRIADGHWFKGYLCPAAMTGALRKALNEVWDGQ